MCDIWQGKNPETQHSSWYCLNPTAQFSRLDMFFINLGTMGFVQENKLLAFTLITHFCLCHLIKQKSSVVLWELINSHVNTLECNGLVKDVITKALNDFEGCILQI